MKNFILIATIIAASIFSLSKCNRFNAFFASDYYDDIYYAQLDPSTEGAAITAPLNYKYATRYGLALCVPRATYETSGRPIFVNREIKHILNNLDGTLILRFLHDNHLISEIRLKASDIKRTAQTDDVYRIYLYEFQLPFPKNDKVNALEVRIAKPITKLKHYSEKTFFVIHSTYSPELD